ncbi:hypothetical protein CEXT_291151 [Caerostris extrusa]|uniref:Uncharacterized protein n=1 Tax=Caerostris extrusa TaxID=172846 RepID=A0AAV4QRI9_CAEEX|nr:hypothetical protein CEXT_291151 [Caerostris extrusa]
MLDFQTCPKLSYYLKSFLLTTALLNHADFLFRGTPVFPRMKNERSGMESKLRVTDGMLILHCRDGCHSTKQEDKPRSIWQRSRPPGVKQQLFRFDI